MQNKTNQQHEVAARAEKTVALAGAILVDAILHNENPFTLEFAEKLASAGLDFWQKVAEKAGRHIPSPLTREAVVHFFRAGAERRAQLSPTQAEGRA